MTKTTTYTFTCVSAEHTLDIDVRSRRKAESLLRAQGWVGTPASWICDAHRDKRHDRSGTWTGAPREGAGIFALDDGHIVYIVGLRVTNRRDSGMDVDRHVLSMRYVIVPVDPSGQPSARPASRCDERRWDFEVRDDLGTLYEVQSGATGFTGPHRNIFDSDIDFEPDVPPAASRIDISFIHGDRREPIHTLHAEMPLLLVTASRKKFLST